MGTCVYCLKQWRDLPEKKRQRPSLRLFSSVTAPWREEAAAPVAGLDPVTSGRTVCKDEAMEGQKDLLLGIEIDGTSSSRRMDPAEEQGGLSPVRLHQSECVSHGLAESWLSGERIFRAVQGQGWLQTCLSACASARTPSTCSDLTEHPAA
ncbi:unnamed protein product [Pleuronectes platessa]|uniref:Uncharacterized protein n=1 Tax=Pleuronectes platessa TaxID=8262 RepID=A0A9N7VNC3_PLEPL|nr:unnamed protein product [Pleuronectes platessa]